MTGSQSVRRVSGTFARLVTSLRDGCYG